MESNSVAENLQLIRTLMERSALYRRALAPVMVLNGLLGLAGALGGWLLAMQSPRSFILFWAGICVLAVAASYLLVRRQALNASEPFWSPPTRRVTEAFLLPLAAGIVLSAGAFAHASATPGDEAAAASMRWLPPAWVVLYGCALHAAAFVMHRGTKVLAWAFVLGGTALFFATPQRMIPFACAQAIMGFFFGVLHLAYGVFLYFTEQKQSAA
ncbi:MAG TPA: hypothetical protein VFD66_14140 [Verrucomicrobiae bacterium]|nr:hypothetical protein [Verrucomicrobiae bacterium]